MEPKTLPAPQSNKLRRSVINICLSLGFCAALAPNATAGFIGNYAPGQFTLVNTNSDGCLADPLLLACLPVIPNSAQTIAIMGGNNGSGDPGSTDLTITVSGTGLLQFHYAYSTLDDPGFDFAGYLLNGVFSTFATFDGQSGDVALSVAQGNTFGFRVGTTDNTGEPGILTISAFDAPSNAIPEPSTASLLLVAGGALVALHRRRSATRTWEEKR